MNISDVAREAGVSVSTVSRVINNNSEYPVREENRIKVLEAIERLNYVPNDLARGLTLKRFNIIALIVQDMANSYYAEIARGIDNVASKHSYAVILCNLDNNPEKIPYYINILRQKRVDGIILAGGSTRYDKQISEALLQSTTEIVILGRLEGSFTTVNIDNVQAGYEATTHLIDLGHRRIGFISGPFYRTAAQDRLRGYRTALEDHGIPYVNDLVIESNYRETGGYESANRLLQQARRPTAIIAANGRMSMGAMASINDNALTIPDEISVVGIDNDPSASYVRPALTTVALATYDMGSIAMDLMLKKLAGDEGVSNEVILDTKLIIRQTTAPPPSNNRS